MLESRVLGQLLLMQSILISLPDEKTIISFICRGLFDIPGVTGVHYTEAAQEQADTPTVRIPLFVGEAWRGELLFTIDDPEAFTPYLDYLKNFCYMLAVILEERRQRRENELWQSQLETRVQERTKQLEEQIAERKLIEESLRKSEERFKFVLEGSQLGFWDWNIETGEVIRNERWAEMLGYTLQEVELSIRQWTDLHHPDDQAAAMKSIEDHLKGLTPVHEIEYRMRTKDGKYRWILDHGKVVQRDAQGKPVRMSGTHTDITERKSSEAERARLIMAIEQVDEGIMIADANWIIQFANPAFERITGYSNGELIGLHGSILENDTHDQAVYMNIRRTLARGEPWSGLISARKKDGALYQVQALSSPVKDAFGNIINYINIRRDVTLERRLERELRQAQKMESIGTLAGGIAHDFNNILGIILGYSELSRTGLPADTPLQGNLTQIMKAALRAKDLVSQILTFSRQTEKRLQPLQIAPVLKEALKLLRSSLPATIEIRQEIEIRPGKGVVVADPTQIHQVLMNLCTNAGHAMRAGGGVLTVSLSELDISAAPLHGDLRNGPYLRLSVTDTGHGMDAAVMERIFDPYFTTKSVGEGTGLGLSVVQGIVKAHGGVITVNSEPARGTTFHVFFPEIPECAAPEALPLDMPSRGNERILFVDDETLLADFGKEMLELLGYEVTAKASSREALEAFRAEPDAFDLVITDMTMPGLTGIALAERLWSVRKDIPIILCSGFSELIDEQQAKGLGIQEYVTKPYRLTTMAKAIRRALDQK